MVFVKNRFFLVAVAYRMKSHLKVLNKLHRYMPLEITCVGCNELSVGSLFKIPFISLV